MPGTTEVLKIEDWPYIFFNFKKTVAMEEVEGGKSIDRFFIYF